MFSGIISGAYPVESLEAREGLLRFRVRVPESLLESAEIGASVCINGVCLTIVGLENGLTFDVMQQSLAVTTLGALKEGDLVNVERSLKYGDEVGGHQVSGHVDTVARITHVETPANNRILEIEIPEAYAPYLFDKGFVAVNGASLTIAGIRDDKRTIRIYLIPETLEKTTFGSLSVGDAVNIEIERSTQVLVDTLTRTLTRIMNPQRK